MPSGHTALDVDTILGLPRPTKKPSSLRKPRQPPAAKYINKQRALAIAKKFKIKQIGKVSLRAGCSDALDDQPKVSLQSEKVLTRRILLDREKGLETAMNAKDSAVGKCILGRNDYETRRLGTEFDKLNEDSDRKSYQLLRKKSVFVHQRGLTLTQGGIVFDPNADTKTRASSDSDPSRPLPAIKRTREENTDVPGSMKREKSPSYLRPLSCDRTRSTNSQVAETERFLASPTMRRYFQPAIPVEDNTAFALMSVTDANISQHAGDDPGHPSKRIFPTETKDVRRRSGVPEIAENTHSEGCEHAITSDVQDGKTQFRNRENFPITRATNRSKSVDQTEGTDGHEANRRHSTAYSILRTTSQSKPEQTKETSDSEDINTRGRPAAVTPRRRSHRKSSTLSTTSFQFKPRRKHRKSRVSFSPQSAPKQFNTAAPSRDPRFTELTSFLVPDSAKAFDLYRDMGRLSVLERLEQQSGSKSARTEPGEIGQIRKSDVI